MIEGIQIYESAFCVEETKEPRRKHRKKQWMSDNYHQRIQKKWTKRFGYVMRPMMYQTPQGFICHPSIAAQLRNAIQTEDGNYLTLNNF